MHRTPNVYILELGSIVYTQNPKPTASVRPRRDFLRIPLADGTGGETQSVKLKLAYPEHNANLLIIYHNMNDTIRDNHTQYNEIIHIYVSFLIT